MSSPIMDTSTMQQKALLIKCGRKKLFFIIPFLLFFSLTLFYRVHQKSSYKAVVTLKVEEPTDMEPTDDKIITKALANQGLANDKSLSPYALKRRLSVTSDGATGTTAISLVGSKPKGLVGLVNEIADVYLREVGLKVQEAKKDLIKKKEPEVREYRKNLEIQLKKARERLEDCEAKASRFRAEDERIADALASLRSRLGELEAERSNLLRVYTEFHPDVVRVDSDIAHLKRELAGIPPRPTGGFELERNLEDSQRRYAALKKEWDEVRSRKVEDIIATNKAVVVTSYAKKAQPLFDPRARNSSFLLGIVLSIAVSLTALMAAALADTSILNPDDLSAYTHLPVIATLPYIKPLAPKGKEKPAAAQAPPDGFILSHSDETKVIEPYRMLYTNLQRDILSGEGEGKSVFVTSSVPREGKTTVASNLALVMARAGKKVMLIDCNLARPAIHKLFGVDTKRPGLINVLNGSAALDSAVMNITDMVLGEMEMARALKTKGLDRLSIMASGAHLPVAGELLRSYKLDALMAELRAKFDFLVLDGPSVTTSADSLILSLKCQVTFLIYSAQDPPTLKGALRSAVNHLLVRRAGTPVKVTSSLRGVIMNRCI